QRRQPGLLFLELDARVPELRIRIREVVEHQLLLVWGSLFGRCKEGGRYVPGQAVIGGRRRCHGRIFLLRRFRPGWRRNSLIAIGAREGGSDRVAATSTGPRTHIRRKRD